jgi:uncharacterized protein
LTSLLLYLATGAAAGTLAGLLGIGGALLTIPLLSWLFVAEQLPDVHILHLALGTSLASILFTSLASLRAHHWRGAVHWPVVRGLTVGILAGSLLGSTLAARLSGRFLKGFFVAFLGFIALQMLLDMRPKASRSLPGRAGLLGAGTLIGGLSGLVGIGGGSLSVPFLVWCNLPIHHAIGTSAAIGFPIALAGTIGYILNGLATAGLPPGSLGFVYLPALAGVTLASICTAPLGARLAHRLPVKRLKRAFAFFLLMVATKLLLELL